MTVVGLCICFFLLWLFALAAYHKLTHLNHYSQLLLDYLPNTDSNHPLLLRSAAAGLAVLELSVALMLILPASRAVALLMAIALLSVYATVMAIQLILGRRQLNCGCAGPAATTHVSAVLVARNILLVVLAVVALLTGSSIVISSYSVLLIVCLTLFMIVLYLCAEQLISNSQRLAALKNV